MNKKILLGSIVSLVILILVSFTSVIGYRSIESDVKVSPLFNIRSSKAIGKERKDMVCDYVGKGESVLSIPKRYNETSRIQKTVDIISKIDNNAFRKMVVMIFFNLKNQNHINDKETSEILQGLHYIRNNPNVMKYYDTNNIPDDTSEYLSCHWFPGCTILNIIYTGTITFFIITAFVFMVTGILLTVFCPEPTWHVACASYNCK